MAVSLSNEDKETEKKAVEKEEEEEDDEEEEEIVVKWANHYSSVHNILLVGEGDFSFSLCLAHAFGSASNIVATSLDSQDIVLKKYNKGKSNLSKLKDIGAVILHEVDATKMKHHPDLKNQKFDRIIFNFPHAGFSGKEDNLRVIKMLLLHFFSNASHMLRPHGEIHVSHKIGAPFDKWNLGELASKGSLILTQCAKFNIEDYPGYNNKRGDSVRCDEPFPLGECRTFMFRIGNARKGMVNQHPVGPGFRTMIAYPSHLTSFQTSHLPPAGYHPHEGWAGTHFLNNAEGISSGPHYPPRMIPCRLPFQSIADPLWNSYPRHDFGYLNQMEEIHRERIARLAWERVLILKYGQEW